jgi:hypothetical protein
MLAAIDARRNDAATRRRVRGIIETTVLEKGFD